jgi:ribosomal protein L20
MSEDGQMSGEKSERPLRKRIIQSSSGIRGTWDHRFHVTKSKDNKSIHPYYKEYFDKKPRNRDKAFPTTSGIPSDPTDS